MEKFRPSPEDIKSIIKVAEYGLLAVGILHLSRLAFSFESRQEILARDGYQCTECGSTEYLEAAHWNHERNDNYDNPENGRTLCTECHLQDHIKRPNNGLIKRHNKWAIKTMRKKIADRAAESIQQMKLPL